MEIIAGSLVAFGGVKTLFSYNQGLWQFDKKQRKGKVFQAMGMAISQVSLWREDLRDLFSLTNRKMGHYTTVSTLVVGFTLKMALDFHLDNDSPTWLFIVAQIFNAASFAYAMLALVFSMYASILVQQFETKCMTEIVRLPIPDADQISHATTNGQEFEDPRNVRIMMRVPVVTGTRNKAQEVGKDTTKTMMTPFVASNPHFSMFKQMQANWLPLANFARVSMLTSLTCTTNALIYFTISRQLGQAREIWGTCLAVLILVAINLLMQKLDFILEGREWFFKCLVHTLPPLIALTIEIGTMMHHERWKDFGAPFIFILHVMWLCFLLTAAHPAVEGGKSKFRLTILQDMQFGKVRKQDMATGASMASMSSNFTSMQSTATDATEAKSIAPSAQSFSASEAASGTFGASLRSVALTDNETEQMKKEVKQFHRTTASLLVELMTLKGDRENNASTYLREFQLLCSKIEENDNPEEVVAEAEPAPLSSSMPMPETIGASAAGSEKLLEIRFVDRSHLITTPTPHGLSTNDGVVHFRGTGFALQVGGEDVPDGQFFYVRVMGPYQLDLHNHVALDAYGDHDHSLVKIDQSSGSGAQLRKAPLTCANGHDLVEKHGQTIFHLTGRFCAICKNDIKRTDTRYTCSSCTKYDVCVPCAKNIQQKVGGPNAIYSSLASAAVSLDGRGGETKKTERMLKLALSDFRTRVEALEKGRIKRRHSAVKADRDAEKRREEQSLKELPTPLHYDKLDEALSAKATKDMDTLPWMIYRSFTSMVTLMFFLAFVWSIVQLCTPDLHLGRPHKSTTTGRDQYLDMAGDPLERRLLSHPRETSQAREIADWFRHLGREDAAEEIVEHDVDGATLRHLDRHGWAELGVASGIERAKLLALLGGKSTPPVFSGGLGGGTPQLPSEFSRPLEVAEMAQSTLVSKSPALGQM